MKLRLAFLAVLLGLAFLAAAEDAIPEEGLPEHALPRGLRQIPAAVPGAGDGAVQTGLRPLTIEGLERELCQRYVQEYSSPGGLRGLVSTMERGGPYLAFIRRQIEERGLPPEFLYLPVIESSYLVTAESRSGAAGLWQFMTNSIAPFDMRVTDWLDERLDFWKSTQGALAKLADNYRALGDWALALAAYNTGLGGIQRVIRETGIKDYWLLSERKLLNTETIQFVPKLLAVAHILANPRFYNLDLNWAEDPRWTRISIDRQVDLEVLAEAAGMDPASLKAANRELLYGLTPPEPGYLLKIKEADLPALALVLAQEDTALIRYYYHLVAYGDTLSALAQHYGVTLEQIRAENPGVEPSRLQLGLRIRIPAIKKDALPYEPLRPENAPIALEGTYTVKKGDTLWSIARAFGMDPQSLAEANNMGLNDVLREGISLKTPIRE